MTERGVLMEPGWMVGLGALVGAVCGAAATLYVRILKAQTDAALAKQGQQNATDASNRKVAMEEMHGVITLLKQEVAANTTHIEELRRQNESQAAEMLRLHDARAADLKESFKAHENCLHENTKLQKQILLLESTVRRMEQVCSSRGCVAATPAQVEPPKLPPGGK